MKPIISTAQLIPVIFITVLLSACASEPLKPIGTQPMSFHTAFPILINNLLEQVKTSMGLMGSGKKIFLIEPFIEENTGAVVKASRVGEDLFKQEAQKNFSDFAVERMSTEKLSAADYIINGTFLYEPLPNRDAQSGKKFYHFLSSIFDRKTGIVVANADIWISDANLDVIPVVDGPMIAKDERTKGIGVISRLSAGSKIDQEYYNALGTSALLSDAKTAYEQKDYQKALAIYSKAAERADGQSMETYTGLYDSSLKLKNLDVAEEAFTKLIGIAVVNNSLSSRFLFEVNKTEFKAEKKEEYQLWLRKIAQYFSGNDKCLTIIGHSSKTGIPEYNVKLSQQRAEAIREAMSHESPPIKKKSKALGEGFEQCKVCSGTDDNKDAVDRRVEFTVVNCNEI